MLPAPKDTTLDQGVSPQTLSVAADCSYKEEAMAFTDFLLRPPSMVRLALGDWLLSTGWQALGHRALGSARHDWATGMALAGTLRAAPAQSVRGYPERKDKIAAPASRSTTAARSAWTRCANDWSETGTWCSPAIRGDAPQRATGCGQSTAPSRPLLHLDCVNAKGVESLRFN